MRKSFLLPGSILVNMFFFILFSSISTGVFAQQHDKPTWGNQTNAPKTSGDYQPNVIKDVFAKNAVTYEDMVNRARYHSYMAGEIVVAIQLETRKAMVLETVKDMKWSPFFGGQNVTLLHHLLSVERGSGSVVLVHLSLPVSLDVFSAMKMVQNKNGVLWSSPNFVYDGDPRDLIPNDPSYGNQYHHPLMKSNLAWDITQGSPGVIIAVTDDGVERTHSDLSANIWVNAGEIAGDGIDNDSNGYIDDVNGWDFSFNNNNPNPNTAGDSHGTHVAGCAAARINNNNGVAGVAGLSTIMPVQFYGTGGAPWTATLINQSFTYAVNNGANIVSTSYNIDGFANDPVFLAAVQYVIDEGALHFNSAGNNSQLNPARQAVTQTLLVASTDNADLKSGFSNYGTGIDISSPGSSILSTVVGNAYDYYSGTSMATPNAAGSAALIWAIHPTWTNYQVAAQLLATADNIYPLNPTLTGFLGSGRINNFAAVTANIPSPKVKSLTGLPAEGSATQAAGITGFTVSFNQVMDPLTVNDVSNFELRNAGTNGIFGDGDDVLFTLTTNDIYRVGTNQMVFQISQVPLICGLYRFSMISGGLRNPFSSALDGDGNGTGGDNFVRNFSIGSLVYTDADLDGYGSGLPTVQVSCVLGTGFSAIGGDCDDLNADINPGETEICNNNIDENCDGLTDFIPGPAGAPQTFTNNTSVAIPGTGSGTSSGSPANPYPSVINVTGVNGTINNLSVKLNQFSHTYPSDVDVLLVSPTGQKMTILSDVGGGNGIVNVNLVLDDAAANSMSGVTLVSGTYKPSNLSGNSDLYPAPAPAGPYQSPGTAGTATFASVFGGQVPNGNWSLYVVDDAGSDIGSFSGGWELSISSLSNLCDALPSLPVVDIVQPTCSSATGTITILSPIGPGYTYSIGAGYQAGLVFNNVTPGNYSVTAKDGNDLISPALNVVVDPQPVAPGAPVVTGVVNVCPYIGTGIPVTYSFAATGANGFNYVLPPNVSLVSSTQNSISVNFLSGFGAQANKQIKVTATSDCGNSQQTIYYLLAQAPVTPSPISGTTSVCSVIGTAASLTYTIRAVAGATSYIWTSQAGTTTINHTNGPGADDTTVTVNFSNGFTASNITVAASNGCGSSNVRSLALTRGIPSTPGLISGPTNACANIAPTGTTATYSIIPVSGATTYTWTVPSGAIGLTGQGTNSISFTYPNTFVNGSVAVTATNGCGTSAVRSLMISKLFPGAPGMIDVIQIQACPNRVFSYTLGSMPANSTSILWTIPAEGTLLSGQGSTGISVSYPATAVNGNVTAKAVNNCGSSAARVSVVKLGACSVVPPPFANSGAPASTGSEGMQVSVFPNPTVSDFKLHVISANIEIINVRILDIQGRSLGSFQALPNETTSFGSGLIAGTYMLEVRQGNIVKTKKLLKY